jgi:hypothetical protein
VSFLLQRNAQRRRLSIDVCTFHTIDRTVAAFLSKTIDDGTARSVGTCVLINKPIRITAIGSEGLSAVIDDECDMEDYYSCLADKTTCSNGKLQSAAAGECVLDCD